MIWMPGDPKDTKSPAARLTFLEGKLLELVNTLNRQGEMLIAQKAQIVALTGNFMGLASQAVESTTHLRVHAEVFIEHDLTTLGELDAMVAEARPQVLIDFGLAPPEDTEGQKDNGRGDVFTVRNIGPAQAPSVLEILRTMREHGATRLRLGRDVKLTDEQVAEIEAAGVAVERMG